MKLNILCFLAMLLSMAVPPAYAEEIRPGVVYEGGTTLTLDEQGVSFTVPTGWKGFILGLNFVMAREGMSDVLGVSVSNAASVGQIEELFSSPQQVLGDMLYQPSGVPSRNGNTVSVPATFVQNGQQLQGQIDAKVGEHGWMFSVVSIAAGEATLDETITAGVETVRTAQLEKPTLPEPGQFSGPWVDRVKDMNLTHRSSSNGFSKYSNAAFCGDGRFSFASSDSARSSSNYADGSSTSLSMYGKGAQSGRWAIKGSTLYLWVENGGLVRVGISLDEKGILLLDGTRYYRNGAAC